MAIIIGHQNATREVTAVTEDWNNAQREVQERWIGESNADRLVYQNVLPYTITNLVLDPSFEQNNLHWSGTSSLCKATYDDSCYGASSFILIRVNSSKTSLYLKKASANIPLPSVLHNYYASIAVKRQYGNDSCTMCFRTIANRLDSEVGTTTVQPTNVWKRIGTLGTPQYTNSQNCYTPTIDLLQGNTNGSCDIYVDGYCLIDLTACFGAGNEPTKEWCDANIPFFEGSMVVMKKPN